MRSAVSVDRAIRPSSRALARLSIPTAFAVLMTIAQPGFAQVCVDPPPIGGAPAVSAAPVGWQVASNSPDIIAGNGLWPGGGYTISDISGTSSSGGTMGLFLYEDPSYVESWQTTLTGLTAGVQYEVAIEWQQATLRPLSGVGGWSGGRIRLTVDGNSTDYVSNGSIAGDGWQTAVKVFTASGPTANFVLGHSPDPGTSGMVVADSGSGCAVVNGTAGPPPQLSLPVPTLSEIGIALMALLVAVGGVLGIRRRRNPNRMA